MGFAAAAAAAWWSKKAGMRRDFRRGVGLSSSSAAAPTINTAGMSETGADKDFPDWLYLVVKMRAAR